MTTPSEFATGVPVIFDRGEVNELVRQLLVLGVGISRSSENLAERRHPRRRGCRFLGIRLGFEPDNGLNDEAKGIHQDALRIIALANGVKAAIQPGLEVGSNGSTHGLDDTEVQP